MLYLVSEHDCPPLAEDARAGDANQIVAFHDQFGDGPGLVVAVAPVLVE